MTAATDIADLLGRTPLFEALAADDRARIAREMHGRDFEAGQIVFSRGDPGHEIYLIVEGRVRLSVLAGDGRALAFNHARAGEIFGEIAVLDGGRRSADATALTPVRAATLSQTALQRMMAGNPRIAEAAIVVLCQRLRATSEQIEDVVLMPIEARLARFLSHTIRLHEQLGIARSQTLDLGMSQSELALLLGASRQSVNGALTALEKSGAVTRVGSLLEYDIERLKLAAATE